MEREQIITATISTYNREKYLPGVLNSLARQTLNKKSFEIVLVDNNSPGNTKEIFEKFSHDHPEISCRYYLETNQGLSYGRNRGIKESKGIYITFIDDDAFLADDYLEKVFNYFETHTGVVAIGGKILLHYETAPPTWENKYLNSLLGFYNPGDDEIVYSKNDYPRGSNMSFRTNVFDKVGLFNVDLGRIGSGLGGSEEKDMFKRIYTFAELKVVYLPDALVFHCVPYERTTTEFIKKQAIGTGVGEKLRVKREGAISTLNRYLIELLKWLASIVLWFVFLLKGQPAKGNMIVKFRAGVSRGLIKGK